MAPNMSITQTFEWHTLSAGVSLRKRVPKWASGIEEWQAIFAEGIPEDPGTLAPLTRKRMATTHRKLRLFVSHRQTTGDTALAKKLANLAKAAGMPVWVDVLDPTLAQLGSPAIQLSAQQRSVATAAVIEIALLNCTHAVALLSPNSRGSMWIPYEYGRIKLGAVSSNVASLVRVGTQGTSIPEYAHLAKLIKSQPPLEPDFATWIRGHASAVYAACL